MSFLGIDNNWWLFGGTAAAGAATGAAAVVAATSLANTATNNNFNGRPRPGRPQSGHRPPHRPGGRGCRNRNCRFSYGRIKDPSADDELIQTKVDTLLQSLDLSMDINLTEAQKVEKTMEIIKDMDIAGCGMKMVCDLAKKPRHTLTLIDNDILDFIGPRVIPGEGVDPFGISTEYRSARTQGSEGKDCSALYPECPIESEDLIAFNEDDYNYY